MDDATFQFGQVGWLALGVVLVLVGLWLFRRADARRRSDLTKLAHPRFHQRLVAGWSPALRWTRRGLWLTAIFAVSVAAARPQLGYEWREVKRKGIDILFALDSSRSMLAQDLTPNRLERARLGILDFLDRLQGDRVGLVPFAGTAFALCPLTLDYDAFRESLNSVSTDLIPQQGTDLASAIEEAGRLFDEEGNNQRFLVLITDGEDLEGEALDAAKEEAEKGTVIYTVGVGAADGQLIPVRGRGGRTSNLRDADGELVRTKLDAATLEAIALATGGLYVPLGRGAEGLDDIYEGRLALAPKSELAQQLEKIPLERFQWPLGVAVICLAAQLLMTERRREPKRKRLPSVARRVKPALVLGFGFLLLNGESRGDAVTVYNEGTSAYSNGDFEDAAESLKTALETSDLELQGKAYYNLGNSLYRIGQGQLESDAKKTIESWKQSLKAFEDALQLVRDDEDAQFNRDFVKRKLEELEQQENPEDQESEDQEEGEDGEGKQEGDEGSENGEKQDQKGDGEKQEGEQSGSDGEPSEDEGSEEEENDNMKGEEERQPEDGEQQGEEEGKEPGEEETEGSEEEDGEGEESGEEEGDSGEEQESGKAGEESTEGGEGQDVAATEGQREEGEMSREEAIRLLETLSKDERIVIPAPLSERSRERLKQKDGKRKTW